MFMAIDVGNTTTVIGLYRGETLVHHWRLSTQRNRTADELAVLLDGLLALSGEPGLRSQSFSGVAISSVVPPLNTALERFARQHLSCEPFVVGPQVKTNMPIRYALPQEVGADRIVNAVAARRLYGAPAVVVDFGTATTFDVVSAQGEFLGGAIAPGVGISAEALFERASRLPRVALARPAHAIGSTTAESMQAGLVFGAAGQVDGIVGRIAGELGQRPVVVATGGLAELIGPECRTVDKVDPLLTLTGLRILFELNR